MTKELSATTPWTKIICRSTTKQNNLLSPSQYDFCKTCTLSAQHAILDIVSTIQTNMDKHLFSCGVFIDLKKAFDTVDHKILLHKLDLYGFRDVINEWFSFYLQGRIQTIQIDSYTSNRKDPTCDVTQGSVLGPLLLLIYINDIQESSEKYKFFPVWWRHEYLYADTNFRSLESIVNQELCIWLANGE